MHVYTIGTRLEPVVCGAAPAGDARELPYVEILTKKEAFEAADEEDRSLLERLLNQSIRFCKLEEWPGCLTGTFYIPSRSMHKSHTGFYYIIRGERVTFIDDSGLALERIKEMAETQTWRTPGAGAFFGDFLEHIIRGDALFITELEDRLAKLEDQVLSGENADFNHVISSYRRKIMVFAHYYLQLSDMGSVLQEDDNHFFSGEENRIFRLFVDRVNRLGEQAQMLREYSVQIREVYQSQIDVRQNQIMKVLTIVTTVFLPLSLIAAWYGMNFKYMPELGWRYGYGGVAVLSLLVLGLCIWLFRKKKFW